ncbi:MAG: hypothetical protein FD149_2476 [Rhodospirillaceae bacterium]|nr:MAG: hypothetical protein FD149_2476 [Rhodospirillaceae bacterium]
MDEQPFFIVGATNDPTHFLIPRDLARLSTGVASVDALNKWRWLARSEIGSDAMERLRKFDLVVVPRETLHDMLRRLDPDARRHLDAIDAKAQAFNHSEMSSGAENDDSSHGECPVA